MKNEEQIALRIKEILKHFDLTQSALAALGEVRQNNLSEMISGKRNVNGVFLVNVCSRLGINPKWLIDGEGEMFPSKGYQPTPDEEAEYYKIMDLEQKNKNLNINERIKRVVDYSGKTINSLSKELDISQPALRSAVKGETYPGFDMLSKIIKNFPEVGIDWIMTGEGEMLKSDKPTVYVQPQQIPNRNVIKYYPSVNGSMGGIEFLDNPDESSIDIILPGFSDCKFAINAFGDSMFPVIKSGQVVLLMEWKERFIDWGHIYMVVTNSGYRAIKYLKPSEKEGFIKCESENKESNPAFEVEVNDIHKLFLVKGWVCRDVI